MINWFYRLLVLGMLSWLCVFVFKEMKQISADNALINATLTQQSRQAVTCAVSALEQVEQFMADRDGTGGKMRQDRLKRAGVGK